MRLANARKELELTVQEIGNILKLPSQTIEIIENNDFHKLHGKTYATGYVRAYANQVNLDADALIADDPELGMVPFDQMPPYIYPATHSIPRRRQSPSWGGALLRGFIVLVFLVAAATTWLQRDTLIQLWEDVSGQTDQSELNLPPAGSETKPSSSETVDGIRLS